jgi:hypothetical protein
MNYKQKSQLIKSVVSRENIIFKKVLKSIVQENMFI